MLALTAEITMTTMKPIVRLRTEFAVRGGSRERYRSESRAVPPPTAFLARPTSRWNSGGARHRHASTAAHAQHRAGGADGQTLDGEQGHDEPARAAERAHDADLALAPRDAELDRARHDEKGERERERAAEREAGLVGADHFLERPGTDL